MLHRVLCVVVGFGLLAIGGLVSAQDDDNGNNGMAHGRQNINSRHLFMPPEDAVNPDADGHFRLLKNPVRDSLHVVVHNLDPETTYDVTISLDGASELLGMITTRPSGDDGDGDGGDGADGEDDEDDEDNGGSGTLRIDTKRGDTLPFEAESVADLVGAVVTVSDGDGNVVLSVEIVDLKKHSPGRDGLNGPDGGDGVEPSAVEEELMVLDIEFVISGPHDAAFVRGDSNGNGFVDIADAVAMLRSLFNSPAPLPYCLDAADANDDGSIDIADPIGTVFYLFKGAGPLPAPVGVPGWDRTPDTLFCNMANLSL